MKEFFKVIAALFLLILTVLGLLVFARNFNKQPSVLLRSTQCNPPCWYGITPGRSTTSQVYAVLDHFKDVYKDTILGEYNRNQELVKIFWFFQRPAEDQLGSVNIKNDRVTYFSSDMYEELPGTRILIDKPAGRRDPLRTWSGYGPIQIQKE